MWVCLFVMFGFAFKLGFFWWYCVCDLVILCSCVVVLIVGLLVVC